MTLHDLFRMNAQVRANAGPVRPSTFHEAVSERTVPTTEDYPSGEDESLQKDLALDRPDNYGYRDEVEKPVGVFITEPIPAELPIKEWNAGSVTLVGNTPIPIAGLDRNRQRLIVRNADAALTVYLVRNRDDMPALGFAVPPGQMVTMEHNSAVWAVSTGAATVSWFLERVLGDGK